MFPARSFVFRFFSFVFRFFPEVRNAVVLAPTLEFLVLQTVHRQEGTVSNTVYL